MAENYFTGPFEQAIAQYNQRRMQKQQLDQQQMQFMQDLALRQRQQQATQAYQEGETAHAQAELQRQLLLEQGMGRIRPAMQQVQPQVQGMPGMPGTPGDQQMPMASVRQGTPGMPDSFEPVPIEQQLAAQGRGETAAALNKLNTLAGPEAQAAAQRERLVGGAKTEVELAKEQALDKQQRQRLFEHIDTYINDPEMKDRLKALNTIPQLPRTAEEQMQFDMMPLIHNAIKGGQFGKNGSDAINHGRAILQGMRGIFADMHELKAPGTEARIAAEEASAAHARAATGEVGEQTTNLLNTRLGEAAGSRIIAENAINPDESDETFKKKKLRMDEATKALPDAIRSYAQDHISKHIPIRGRETPVPKPDPFGNILRESGIPTPTLPPIAR